MGQQNVSVSGGATGIPYPTLFKLALLAGAFGIGHHIDHVLRGNHVGWPLIDEATPFTYSLGIYPFIVVGLYLHLRGRIGPDIGPCSLHLASYSSAQPTSVR